MGRLGPAGGTEGELAEAVAVVIQKVSGRLAEAFTPNASAKRRETLLLCDEVPHGVLPLPLGWASGPWPGGAGHGRRHQAQPENPPRAEDPRSEPDPHRGRKIRRGPAAPHAPGQDRRRMGEV